MNKRPLTVGVQFRIESEPAPHRKFDIYQITGLEDINESTVIECNKIRGGNGPFPRTMEPFAVPHGTTIEQLEEGTYAISAKQVAQ